VERARRHFGAGAGHFPMVKTRACMALAEAVTIQKQQLKEFESLLGRALAIHRRPCLAPIDQSHMQRRARWLLSRKAELFLIDNEGDKSMKSITHQAFCSRCISSATKGNLSRLDPAAVRLSHLLDCRRTGAVASESQPPVALSR